MKTRTALNEVMMATLVMLGMGSATAWAGDNVWTGIGPEGGLVQSLAVDPQNPGAVYASTNSNLYRSTDGAVSWAKTGFTGHANSLVTDPLNSGTLYAATPSGVSKSTDGGTSWSAAGSGLPGAPIFQLIIDPQNSSTLYALSSFAISGRPLPGPNGFGPTVFKTTDGGITWNPASSGLAPGNYALTIAIDPRNPGTLYAGTSSAPFSRSAGSGLFKSTDGGASWSIAGSGIPDCCTTAVAVDPQDSNRIYAAWTPPGGIGGIARSTDGGSNWNQQESALPWVLTLAIDPRNPDTLYAATVAGFVKSTNGGTNWNQTNLPGRVQSFAIDPQNPVTVYAAPAEDFNGSGVFKTTDGGGSWNTANSGIREIPVRNVAIDPQHAGTLYGANGGKVLKTADGGAHWIAGDVDGWKVVIDSRDPDTVFTLGFYAQPAKSTDGGASWTQLNLPLAANDFVTDLAIDPQNSGVVYAGTAAEGVLKSTDGGASWSPVNSGLPEDWISVLAISRLETTTVYTGAVSGCDGCGDFGDGVFKSADGGSSWIAVNSGLPGGSVLHGRAAYSIAVDPRNPATLYIVLAWGDINAASRGLFKSIDGGTSWNQLPTGLPESSYIGPLAIDPRDSGTVYLGTDTGVLRSTDGGETWSASSGLPEIYVSSLAIDPQDPNRVYAGTPAGLFVITFVP